MGTRAFAQMAALSDETVAGAGDVHDVYTVPASTTACVKQISIKQIGTAARSVVVLAGGVDVAAFSTAATPNTTVYTQDSGLSAFNNLILTTGQKIQVRNDTSGAPNSVVLDIFVSGIEEA